jgi:hypothetical protein
MTAYASSGHLRLGSKTNGADVYRVATAPNGGGGLAADLGSLALDNVAGTVWYKSGAADTDWTQLGAATPSAELWGLPATPHAADDEFDTNALAAAWLQTGFSGNMNFGTRPVPYAAPAVNAASWENLHGEDNSSAAGLAQNTWLRMQPGLGFEGAWQPIDSAAFGGAVPADLLVWARFRFGFRNATGISAGDYDCGISLFEDTGAGMNFARHTTMSLSNTSEGTAGLKPVFSVNPGSGEVVVEEGGLQIDGANQILAMFSGYIALQKIGNEISAWLIDDSGNVYFGTDSSVGYANLNAVAFWCNTISGSAANGGIPIFDIDFIRFYQGIWLP